jgi:hypothetical protein
MARLLMEDIAVLDTPIPLVVGDSWEWFVVLWADPERRTPYDLTGKSVEAEILWDNGGIQLVTVDVADPVAGRVTISLSASETARIPLGRVSALFLDVIDGEARATWFRAAIEGKSGGSVTWLRRR